MKIMELANAVSREDERLRGTSRNYNTPVINIYMTIDYYHECMGEIHGAVHALAYELYENGTIMGHKVHKVIGDTGHNTWEIFGSVEP